MPEKMWYESKTLWVNIITMIAVALQARYGWVVSGETQIVILGVLNLILRVVTKKPVVFS